MSGELIRREAFSPDRRKHNKVERAAIEADRFQVERERLRQAGRAQLADDKGELAVLLANRAAVRAANNFREMAMLQRLNPDCPTLAMDFADLRAVAHHIQVTAIQQFGQA